MCSDPSNITQPTLTRVGSDDAAARDLVVLAEMISGSRLIQIGTAEHGLMYQLPDAFNGLLMDFLEISREQKE